MHKQNHSRSPLEFFSKSWEMALNENRTFSILLLIRKYSVGAFLFIFKHVTVRNQHTLSTKPINLEHIKHHES